MKGKFYLVYNEQEDRPEYSNGQSGSYNNLYVKIGPAKSLRTKRHNYLKKIKTIKYLEEGIVRVKDDIAETRKGLVTGKNRWDREIDIERWKFILETELKCLEELEQELVELKTSGPNKLTEIFTVYELDLATGASKMVVDGKGNIL